MLQLSNPLNEALDIKFLKVLHIFFHCSSRQVASDASIALDSNKTAAQNSEVRGPRGGAHAQVTLPPDAIRISEMEADPSDEPEVRLCLHLDSLACICAFGF